MDIVSNTTFFSFSSIAVASPLSRSALRWDFANTAAGVALLTVAFAALAVFLVAVPIGALFSSTLITISLCAKTFKEAESYLTQMTFIVLFPAIAAVIPGLELTTKLALIPILNVSLLCKELIPETYN